MTLTDAPTQPASPGKPGPKGVNWLAARTLYFEGLTHSAISRRLGVRREEVSRRCALEQWRAQREAVYSKTAQRLAAATVKSNAQILAQHDTDAEQLLTVARTRLAAIKAAIKGGDVAVDSAELKDIATVVARGAAIQRASRGIGSLEGFVEDEDRRFILEVRRLPPRREALPVQEKEQLAIARGDEVA